MTHPVWFSLIQRIHNCTLGLSSNDDHDEDDDGGLSRYAIFSASNKNVP